MRMASCTASADDPFRLSVRAFGDPKFGNGYTLVDPRLVAGETTEVWLCIGQSMIANWSYGAYSPTQSRSHMFNLWDGGVYAMSAQMIGSDIAAGGYSFIPRLADKRISRSRCARVIACNIALGGRRADEFDGTGSFDNVTTFYIKDRIQVACRRLLAAGLTPTHVLYSQGSADAYDSGPTPYATYLASLQRIIALIRAEGVNAPILVALECLITGSVTVGGTGWTNVRTAQAAVVNHGSGVWQGPDHDSLGAGNRGDAAHWNATGADAVADMWDTQMQLVS